jgi:AsmA protein
MPKVIKWLLAIVVGLIAIILVSVWVAPMVINFDRYKPLIETEASKVLGRPVTVGGKIEPSVFPWIGVAIHDLHLGNPRGFEQKDFVSIGLFEVRIKLWPLLFGNYKLKRFVLNDPRIVLIKQKDGRTNWEGLGETTAKKPGPKPRGTPPAKGPLPIKGLAVGQFAISNGSLQYIDQAARARHEINHIQLTLADISLNRPIRVNFSASVDNHPVRLSGMVGPVGSNPGKSPLDVNLTAELLERIQVQLVGRVENLMDSPQAAMAVQVAPFSLRNVMADLNHQPMPIESADKNTLTKIALSMKLSGTPDHVNVSDGRLTLDESQMTFSAQAKEFAKPKIKLEAALDHIDLDRYLPPPSEGKPSGTPKASEHGTAPAAQKTNYEPLRKLILDAQLKVGELKVKNARTRNIVLKAKADKGIIRIDPLNIDLYDGRASIASTINVQQDTPRSETDLSIAKVQAGPLLKDVMKKDLIEGVLNAAVSVQMVGDQPAQIRRTLNGKGELKFTDGAIVGIDLVGMVRNVQAAFGLAKKPTQKPRTDFSELVVPFTVADGQAKLANAQLQSPLLRVTADGRADLVRETLNIRVEPKFVATLKGQGDIRQHTGIMVPVVVGGTFDKPRFTPDLKAIIKQRLTNQKTLKKLIPQNNVGKELEKGAQELFKQFGK